MSNLYKIAKSDSAVLKILRDEDCESPREWDNLGTMVCWHRRYDLGDKHNYSEPRDFLQDLASELFGYEDVDIIKQKADKHMEKYQIVKSEKDEVFDYFDILENGTVYEDGYDTKESAEKELSRIRETYIDVEVYEEMSNNELLELIGKKATILPLYLYDHSGITMSTGDFGDRWDSGQVGWIYCTKERLLKETSANEDNWQELGKEYLTNEVKTYDNYLTGDVYGFVFEKLDSEALKQYLQDNGIEFSDLDEDDFDSFEIDNDSCWGYYGDEGIETSIKAELPTEYQYLINELQYA